MLEIIRTAQEDENIEVSIAEEGLTEEFQPIEEMGRLKTWKIQSAPLTKTEYIELKNELEKPGFLQVTGKFLHPNQAKKLYLKAKAEIISLNQERDDIHYSIEFRLKDAEGLYGGAQDVTPTYTTIVFELLDINNQPLTDVEIDMYNITRTTDENGKARFDNFYTLREFNFTTGEWEYNEQGLDYTIKETEGKTWEINRNVYIEQERYDITLTIDKLNENMGVDYPAFSLEYEYMYYDIDLTVLDYNDGLPLSDVAVTMETTDELDIAQTKTGTTDINGNVVIEDIVLENEEVEITMEHTNYEYDTVIYYTANYEEDKTSVIETTMQGYNPNPEYLEPPVNILMGFGLEYEEMLIDVDFTVTDWNTDLVEGCKIYYTNHRDDYFEVTTDIKGQATLEDFRVDEEYTVYFEYNNESTKTTQIVPEQEALDANWDSVTRNIVLIEGGSYPEYSDSASLTFNAFDLNYEGGFFVDFSETNILDDWTSRYVSDFETWSIIDDTGATGGKLLKHDTSQNIRRLFSFDPFWELWTDTQFGKRVWEDMEIVGKVKATVDTGNQNRLHVRSGYNIGDIFPIDNINPTYSLIAILYKLQMDINFTVKDDLDSTLLESAEITLELDYGGTKQQTTDINGEASFLDEDSGTLTYNYEVTRPGYTTATGTFTVTKDTATHNEEILMTAI